MMHQGIREPRDAFGLDSTDNFGHFEYEERGPVKWT
jgi:hypothetical protein